MGENMDYWMKKEMRKLELKDKLNSIWEEAKVNLYDIKCPIIYIIEILG